MEYKPLVTKELTEMLLSLMAYEDDDESLLDADKDLVQDDDSLNVWNSRKCSSDIILILSNGFPDEIVLTLMPLIETKLSRSDDETWKEREAIVFALGTIAQCCFTYLYPHLSKLVAFLLSLLDDKFPLIRCISCWTLSQYGIYLLKESDQESYEQFEKVVVGFLCKLLDKNKRVQKAACLAFTTLEKDAGEDLVPHLGVILQHIICAFVTDQRLNIGIVYDAIRRLSKSVGEELNKPGYLEIVIIPPLVAKWQQLSNSDKDLHLMLECFTSISQALGARFIPFAKPVFQRCIKIIQQQQLAKVGLASAGAQYDKEIIVHSLDFLYDLSEGLGSGIESLVSQSNLRDMLIQYYCKDIDSNVKERAFAFMGVLARVFPVYLQPRLHEFLEIASQQLNANVIRENVNVATNACWAIGELAVKVRQEVSPIVTNVVSSLGLILQYGEWDNTLIENSAITLGRLAWIFPDLVAPQMEHYLEPWCMSFSMLDDEIKEETFRGLCAVVKTNPLGVGSSLFFICQDIASWHPVNLEILMYPLVAKLQQLSKSDKDIFPLLKCFSSISQALGVGFAPFAQPVFQSCMDIIHLQQLAKVGHAPAGAQYDKEFIIHSLDFLYDLAGGLKSGIESLVSQSSLRDILIEYCMDKASDVRERAFALMGALARVFPVYLQPRLLAFLKIASQQLSVNVIRENVYATTNACWAIGELAVKVRQEVSPIVANVVPFLGRILQLGESVNKALVENSAITLGRLAWICPDLVAPHMKRFLEPWCRTLSMLNDSIKKEDAFRGLCAVVKVNPLGVANSLSYICQAIASWHEIRSEDVRNEVSQVLNIYKNMQGRNSWEQCLSLLDPLVKERLERYYVEH